VTTTDIPESDLLWHRPLPLASDRSRALTPEEIADAAFGIADKEDLRSVSVRRVANKLHVTASRLENYLADKQDLYDLMLDCALAQILRELPEDHGPWRPAIEAIARSAHRVVSEHPSVATLIGARPPLGPAGLEFTERSLASFADVDVVVAAQCVNAVLAFVSGYARIEPAAAPAGGVAVARSGYLAEATSDGRHPHLAELFSRAGNLTAEQAFDTGLGYLLAGIGLQLDQLSNTA
jgi:AcrR family transcriptional regulator